MEFYSLLITGLSEMSFNASPSAVREGLQTVANTIRAATRPDPRLYLEARNITEAALVEPDEPDEPAETGGAGELRLLKCDHNHVSEFTLDGVGYIHKIYGEPGRWMRECIASGFAHETGLDGVRAPMLVECIEGPAGPVFYSVFQKNRDGMLFAACDGITNAQRSKVFLNLGRWARAYHDSLSRLDVPIARRRFSVNEKCLFDTGPLLRRGLFDRTDCATLDEVSNQYLELLGDEGNALIHNDLGTFTNFFVDIPDDGRIAQVIDYEFTHIGFRSAELLWVYIDAPLYFGDFVNGYNYRWPVSPLPLLELWSKLYRVVDATGYNWRESPACRCPRSAVETPATAGSSEVLEQALAGYKVVLEGMVAKC